MLNYNRAQIIGNLTRDPELRYTPGGQTVVSFGVATNRRRQTQEGSWENMEPEFHNVVVWGKLAEACQKVLHKGDRVFVSGRLQTRSWEGQDGGKRQRTEIIADTVVGPDQTRKALGVSAQEEVAAEPEGEEIVEEEKISQEKPKPAKSSPKKKKPTKEEESEEEIDLDDIPF